MALPFLLNPSKIFPDHIGSYLEPSHTVGKLKPMGILPPENQRLAVGRLSSD